MLYGYIVLDPVHVSVLWSEPPNKIVQQNLGHMAKIADLNLRRNIFLLTFTL